MVAAMLDKTQTSPPPWGTQLKSSALQKQGAVWPITREQPPSTYAGLPMTRIFTLSQLPQPLPFIPF